MIAPPHATAVPEPSEPALRWQKVAIFSRGMARIPHLAVLLGARRVVVRPTDSHGLDAVVGWGEKSTARAAIHFARRHGLPYWRAEDGFLRSVGLGVAGDPPLSIVLDDLGIYYDARRASRLERLLAPPQVASDPLDDPALLARARAAIDRIVSERLSKYNDSPIVPPELGPRDRPRVLVVDQTFGDLSVRCGLARAETFTAMVDAALAEHPDAEIVIKTHPDVVTGKKRGYLAQPPRSDRVRLLAARVNPMALLDAVDRVYVVSSQLGFEALMAGKPVTCFGAPFYAGWGLTDDRLQIARRGRARSVEQVFAAAYLLYPRYLDPDRGVAGTLEQVIDHLALQRAQFARNQGRIYCLGFRLWKRAYVRAYLRSPGNRIEFARDAAHAERLGFDRTARLLCWGQRGRNQAAALSERHGVTVERMEDGFLRSVGLGSDLVTPASLVVDRKGIYYDPTGPSELEEILETAEFTADELGRARALREHIVHSGLSKYNVGERQPLPVPGGRKVILVPGQVEDDASIRLGCRDVRTNLGLLELARRSDPDAFVVYKPHPDVLSGNRAGKLHHAAAVPLCDHIETSAALADCLAAADEVHTMTSLVGFEALLRGLRVVVYGQPFYSGWGLTEDRHPVARRSRRLSLDQLVAGTLLRYPRYLNRTTGRFTTPEVIIEELQTERDQDPAARRLELPWARRQLRKLVHLYKGVTGAV